MVVLSKESADALANVPDLGRWSVAPTMLRGAVKTSDMLGIPKKKEPKLKPSKAAAKEQKKTVLEELDQDASKKKNQEVPVSDLTYKHYRRSAAGGLNMKNKLREIFELDKKAFESVPCFDMETGKCRLKLEQANLWTWPEMLDIAPECFDKLYLIKIYAFQIFAMDFRLVIFLDVVGGPIFFQSPYSRISRVFPAAKVHAVPQPGDFWKGSSKATGHMYGRVDSFPAEKARVAEAS